MKKVKTKNKLRAEEIFKKAHHEHESGRFVQAKELYLNVIKINPNHFDAFNLLGLISITDNDFDLAVSFISEAIRINPKNSDSYLNLSNAFKKLNKIEESILCLRKGLSFNPKCANSLFNLGNLLSLQGKKNESIECYSRAIKINPLDAEIYVNHGIDLVFLGRISEALDNYDAAISLNNNMPLAHLNRGAALFKLNRFNEAIKNFDILISLNSNLAVAYYNRGNAFRALGFFQKAICDYDISISLDKNHAYSYFNKSDLLLSLGQFDLGLELFEWRWKIEEAAGYQRYFDAPLWLGKESLDQKTILLHSEMGLGDSINYCRYASLVKQLGGRVILEAPPQLINLFKELEGVDFFVEKGQLLPAFDFHCPLGSLPYAFKTTVTTIPRSSAYLFKDSTKYLGWIKKLGAKKKLRIGIAWSSTSSYKRDLERSMSFSQFFEYMPTNFFEFVCLQKVVKLEDQEDFQRSGVLFFGDELNDFSDTAALASCMDLVISTCTSVPHMTAALGLQTWILLGTSPDWRWLHDRNDSPWYDSVKLYRQRERGDWSTILMQVADDLLKL